MLDNCFKEFICKRNDCKKKNENRNKKEIKRETTLERKNRGARSRVIDARIANRIQGIEERISSVEDVVEEIGTTVKENSKHKTFENKVSRKFRTQ